MAHRQFGQFEIQVIQLEIYRQFSLRQFSQFYKTLYSKEKKSELELFLRLRSLVGALRARRRFATITGSKNCIESYPLLAVIGYKVPSRSIVFMLINENLNLLRKVFCIQILVAVFIVLSCNRSVLRLIVVRAVISVFV